MLFFPQGDATIHFNRPPVNKKREIRFPDIALHSFTCPTSSNFLEFELYIV